MANARGQHEESHGSKFSYSVLCNYIFCWQTVIVIAVVHTQQSHLFIEISKLNFHSAYIHILNFTRIPDHSCSPGEKAHWIGHIYFKRKNESSKGFFFG